MYSPNFIITNQILKNIGLIEAAREVIKNSPLLPLWERKFQEEAALRTIHHGTHIEGNPLNLNEVQKVVEGGKVVARERDIQEVINYRQVVEYISQEQEISENTVKKLHQLTTHRLLPTDQCGTYRKKQVVVKNSQTGEVTFRPPPAIEVPYLMEEFLAWLGSSKSQELHPVLKAGVTQYEIVHIHPFLDGNGRVARALAVLSLYQEGYDIRRFFSLEEYYDKDALKYYQALQSVQPSASPDASIEDPRLRRDSELASSQEKKLNTADNLTPWLEYFSLGLAVELTRVKERVQKLSSDLALKERLGGEQVYLSERQIKIIEFIQRAGLFRNNDFPVLFPMISEDTVLRELKDLAKKGIIKKKGKTKAAKYVLK